jgi:hypothetical protein
LYEPKAQRGTKDLNGHSWYQRLRDNYPNEDECWVWPNAQFQVTAGAFREDAGTKVHPRVYLYQELIGPVERFPLREGRDCKGRCVNPKHAVNPVAAGDYREVPEERGREVTLKYAKNLLRFVMNSMAMMGQGEKRAAVLKEMRMELYDRNLPFIDADWRNVSAWVNNEMVAGRITTFDPGLVKVERLADAMGWTLLLPLEED